MASFKGNLASVLDRVAELEKINRALAQRAGELEAMVAAERARAAAADDTTTQTRQGDRTEWTLAGAALVVLLVVAILGVVLLLALYKAMVQSMGD